MIRDQENMKTGSLKVKLEDNAPHPGESGFADLYPLTFNLYPLTNPLPEKEQLFPPV